MRGSNRTGRPYSSSIRLARTSNCKLPDDADDEAGADHRAEHLGGTFFGKLHQRLFQMFGLQRIACAAGLQQFRRETGNASDADRLALSQRVTDAQLPVVRDADDVACPGLFGQFAVAGQKHALGW